MKSSGEVEEAAVVSGHAERLLIIDQAEVEDAVVGAGIAAVHRAADREPADLAWSDADPRVALQVSGDDLALATAATAESLRSRGQE
jgi:23S rRNA G2445 N2-methylase RlmL